MISRSVQDRGSGLSLSRGWLTTLIGIVVVSVFLNGCTIQTGPKVYRVGILSGLDAFKATIDGFQAEMTRLGYEEGNAAGATKTILYDVQSAGGNPERMKQIAEQFVADEVDLILTTTTAGARAAQEATVGTDIPIVFTIVLDPLGSGLVADLREPGRNITGVGRPIQGFLGKRVEFLQQMVPEAKRLWLPYDPSYPTAEVSLQIVGAAAQALEITLIETPVSTADEVIAELEKRSETEGPGFEAVFIPPDPLVQGNASWQAILAFAKEHNLPIIGNVPGQVEGGALFSYTDDNFETGQLAAALADQILQGNQAGVIPVTFSDPQLVINYRVAQNLGLTIEDSLLALASQVIQ